MRQAVRWMNYLSVDVMAKRAKKKVIDAVWQDGNEDLLKSMIEKRSNSKIEICIDNNVGLSQLASAIKSIPEEIERPVHWYMDMSMKYGLSPYDDAIRLSAPRHIIVKTKKDFESKLTREQIEELLPVMNNYIFVEKQSVESVNRWLKCENEEPIKVKNNGLLAYLLYLLQKENYICFDCQGVAEKGKVFIGLRGRLLTKSNLSKSMTHLVHKMGYPIKGDNILNKDIFDAIKGLGK